MTEHLTPRHYTRSSSFQMAVLFTVLCGLAVLAMTATLWMFQRERIAQEIDAIIQSDLFFIDRLLSTVPADDIVTDLQSRSDRIYTLFEADHPPSFLQQAMPHMAEGTLLAKNDTNDWVAGRIHTLPDGRYLFMGLHVDHLIATYDQIRMLSWLCIGGMIIVIFLSFAISVFVVRGTNTINRTAARIMRTGDLSARIDVRSHWDDLSFMAVTLNAMLARIEHLTSGVRLVADGIAHDLRTPLTRLRARLERLEQTEVNSGASASMTVSEIQQAIAETDNLLATFHALLRIGRIETGRERHGFAAVDLRALIHDAIDLYHPLFDEKAIEVHLELSPAHIEGDRDLLFQLFVNLLDNALKYTPSHGSVRIQLCMDSKGKASFQLFNSGTGVGGKDLARLGERFYRGEQPPSQPGSGLGLALVRAIADLHGWDVCFINHPMGFEVTIKTGGRS